LTGADRLSPNDSAQQFPSPSTDIDRNVDELTAERGSVTVVTSGDRA